MKRFFATIASVAGLLSGCSSVDAGTQQASTPSEAIVTTRASGYSGAPVTSLVVGGNHRVDFVIPPPGGPVGVVEVMPIGGVRLLDETTLATKKSFEIYTLLNGIDPSVLAALHEAEAKSEGTETGSSSPPPPSSHDAEGGAAPRFYTASEASYFQSNFCKGGYSQCLLYNTWVGSAYGHHQGRGYFTAGMQGSEAKSPRVFETDYWNGSAWASLYSVSLPPGSIAAPSFGNIGAPSCSDHSWYFRSEIIDNNDGSGATTDMTDFVYSAGGGVSGTLECYNNTCSGTCGGACCSGSSSCPAGRGAANYVTYTCTNTPQCADNSCSNPP